MLFPYVIKLGNRVSYMSLALVVVVMLRSASKKLVRFAWRIAIDW